VPAEPVFSLGVTWRMFMPKEFWAKVPDGAIKVANANMNKIVTAMTFLFKQSSLRVE